MKASYENIEKSVLVYGHRMPEYEYLKSKFFEVIDKTYYSVDVVNSDNDVEALLNEETGELYLETPFSIFVGGQTLDRGVTIPNMIGFYYGRNPKTMQQDTVLQHSRMFGYRKELMPVTRFYTSLQIYESMVKITEIDADLRQDIKSDRQGNGVYFITKSNKQATLNRKNIKPCSPAKIRVSNIIMLNSNKRILPVGFSPVPKTEYNKANNNINKLLKNKGMSINENCSFQVCLDEAEAFIRLAYMTIQDDKNSSRFINVDEMITSLRYMSNENAPINMFIKRNRYVHKYRDSGALIDTPDTSQTDTKEARHAAINNPSLLLFQQVGDTKDWGGRPFWWPLLVAPRNVPKTIYASKIVGEKIARQTKEKDNM